MLIKPKYLWEPLMLRPETYCWTTFHIKWQFTNSCQSHCVLIYTVYWNLSIFGVGKNVSAYRNVTDGWEIRSDRLIHICFCSFYNTYFSKIYFNTILHEKKKKHYTFNVEHTISCVNLTSFHSLYTNSKKDKGWENMTVLWSNTSLLKKQQTVTGEETWRPIQIIFLLIIHTEYQKCFLQFCLQVMSHFLYYIWLQKEIV